MESSENSKKTIKTRIFVDGFGRPKGAEKLTLWNLANKKHCLPVVFSFFEEHDLLIGWRPSTTGGLHSPASVSTAPTTPSLS